jgi:malonyl CoA-acyl carrier protein transacylase
MWLLQTLIPDDEQTFLACISQQCLLKRTISYEHLAIFVSANLMQLREQLDAFLLQHSAPGLIISKRLLSSKPRVCFVFSGQGPQWWAMGRQLYSCEPVFRRWIQSISHEFNQINNGDFNLLEEMIEKTEQESRINDTNIAQPAIFSIQVALSALLLSWHIFPSAVVSHSAGEQAASFLAGRFSLKEAVCIVYHRSRLQHRNTRQGGGMLAVAMSEAEVRQLLLQGIEHLVSVAVVNSPRSVTLSGEETVISELESILSAFHPKVFKARLRIQNAFHSHQMDRFDIKQELFSTLGHIRGLPLQDSQLMFNAHCAHVPFYSSVTGSKMNDNIPLDAQYWWSNVRQCVRFGDAIQSIMNDEIVDAFLELSPHPVLAMSIRECYEKTNTTHPVILPTLKRKEDEQATLLSSIVQLSHSPDVWKHYLSSRSAQTSQDIEHLFDTFPLYAFNTTPCWYEPKESVMERRAYRQPTHPLLGVRQWSQHTSATWKSLINIKLPEHAYLVQHKMQDAILFPATAFLELALAACRQLLPTAADNEMPTPIAFENIEFIKALVLTEHELTEVITQVVMPMREWFVYSRPWSSTGQDMIRPSGMACDDFIDSFVDLQSLNTYSLRQFTLHARGHIDIGPHLNIYASLATRFNNKTADWTSLDPANMYAGLSSRGCQYDLSFKVTDSIQSYKSQVSSRVSPRNGEENDSRYHLHPAIVDGCLHAPLFILPGVETFLPATIGKMIVYGSTFHVPEVIMNAVYHSSLAGLSQERAFTLDGDIFDSRDAVAGSNVKPIVMFQMFKIQRVPGHWSPSSKTLLEKVNELRYLPNTNTTEYMDTLTAEHCLQKKWTSILIDSAKTVDLLPSADTLINNVEQLQNIKCDGDDFDTQLTNSIESLNELAANYALYALQHLSSSKNAHFISEDELQHHVRDDDPYFLWFFQSIFSLVRHHGLIDEHGNSSLSITNHSLQLKRKQILDQYPLLKSILALMNINGIGLDSILSGTRSVDDLFMQNKDIELILADVLNIISSSKTSYVFQALTDHVRDTRPKHLRILIVGSGTSSIALPILQQLINFTEQTDAFVKLLYVDLTEALLAEVAQAFQTILIQDHKQNQRVSVSYSVYDMQAELNESSISGKYRSVNLYLCSI